MSAQRCNVVVVEDSDEDFDTFQVAADKVSVPLAVTRADSADACVDLFGRYSPGIRLILLDLNLPGADGREILRTLRSDRRWGTVPIVVFSTSNRDCDIGQCYEMGANAYHVKPLRYDLHVQTVREILKYWLTQVTAGGPDRNYGRPA